MYEYPPKKLLHSNINVSIMYPVLYVLRVIMRIVIFLVIEWLGFCLFLIFFLLFTYMINCFHLGALTVGIQITAAGPSVNFLIECALTTMCPACHFTMQMHHFLKTFSVCKVTWLTITINTLPIIFASFLSTQCVEYDDVLLTRHKH